MTKPQNPRRRERRVFRVPPPLVQRIDAPKLSGTDLLDDEIGSARLVFWQAFQDAELWARAEERRGLFHPGRRSERRREVECLDPQTYDAAKPHLSVLIALTERPTSIQADAVRDACAELAIWFENRGLLRCAVEFAKVASFAAPEEAPLVVRIARLLRMLGEFSRSISWFDYGYYIARRNEDWRTAAKALTGLGILFYQRGNYPRSRLYQRRCLNLARKRALPDMAGEAFHNLFVLEMDAGNVELADSHATRALALYPSDSACLILLARDLAQRWTLAGHFKASLPVQLETLQHVTRAIDRVQAWAGAGRAAAGAGERGTFEEAWLEAWHLIQAGLADPVASIALLDLAQGAVLIGDRHRAAYAARKALDFAQQRGEGHTIFEAEALLTAIQNPEPIPTRPTAPAVFTPPTLVYDVIDRLKACPR
ncbi:MAG: Tetratricopeptide repeat-containing protein [Gemmatimonadetes bacterium]|nr:Tetratricopeptide repeat-containing protein [Gemmatimonadota bacterium]